MVKVHTTLNVDPNKRDLAKLLNISLTDLLDKALDEALPISESDDLEALVRQKMIDLKEAELAQLKDAQTNGNNHKKKLEDARPEDEKKIKAEIARLGKGKGPHLFEAPACLEILNKTLKNKITLKEFKKRLSEAGIIPNR